MNRFNIKILSIFILLAFIFPPGITKAQSENTAGPVYIIQEGDSLWEVAARFHVSLQDLENANGIVDPGLITIGQHLIIPGLEGIEGVLTTRDVQFGETLQSLSMSYRIPISMLERLNHITSPNELFAGYSLIVPQEEQQPPSSTRYVLNPGQSMLELAAATNTNPWAILTVNNYTSTTQVLPEDVIRVPGGDDSGMGDLPPGITAMSISRLSQGETAEFQISGEDGLTISGTMMGHSLNFFPQPGVGYVALQGIHAMAEPGLYPVDLVENMPEGSKYQYSQNVLVSAGDFLYDVPLSVDPATLDPETTVPEDQLWMSLASKVSPEKLWQGIFSLPVDPIFAECYASRFGSRRSYNGSEYSYFHTGLDFCGQVGDPIYATAAGEVVFTGMLTVRGNATMIDHGDGVFSAYMHQSEVLVNVGDRVEQGQLIGRVGNTGRVEGPHLHFEVLVGGVQVNPIDWLNQAYP